MARSPMPEGILRFLWTRRHTCPMCNHTDNAKKICQNGRRRTVRCPACGSTSVQVATHAEVDQGGGKTEIQAL